MAQLDDIAGTHAPTLPGGLALQTGAAPARGDLLRRAQMGDVGAAAELFERHRRVLSGLVSRRGVPPQHLEDLLQQVESRFLRNVTRVSAPTAFLLTTASNVVSSFNRKAAREREAMAEYARLRSPPIVAGEARLILRLDLRHALAAGGRKCRDLIREFVVKQVSYSEYAEATGTPRGTLGPAVGRCLRRVRHYLVARGYDAESGVRE